jgi:hypothetical protein
MSFSVPMWTGRLRIGEVGTLYDRRLRPCECLHLCPVCNVQMERIIQSLGHRSLESIAERACGSAALVSLSAHGHFPRLRGRASAVTALCLDLVAAYHDISDTQFGAPVDVEFAAVSEDLH